MGGVPSLITDNETGLLASLDPAHLATQARRLATDPNLEGEPPVVHMQIDWELVFGGAV